MAERVCYQCQKPGHFARECPERPAGDAAVAGGEGGSGGRTCYKCGKAGHFARECYRNTCYNCGDRGHFARDCPQPPKEDGEAGGAPGGGDAPRAHSSAVCYNCGKTGHFARDCGDARNEACFRCGQAGHYARECPNEPADEQ